MVQFRTVVCLLSFLVLSLAACPSQVECRAVVPSQANVAEHAPVEVDQMMAESPRELKTAKANVTEPGTDEAAEVGAGKHVSVALKLTMYIVLLLITFVTLAIVCDDYLAEALEELSEALHIPHDVACASFLAFGSSAPEICINCIATARGKVDVSMGAIMGSGILAYTVIPAVCVLVSNGQTLHLELVPLIRDCVSYLVALLLFVLFVMNGSMGLREDVVLVSLFFVYIALQFVLGKFYHAPGADLETPSENGGDPSAKQPLSSVAEAGKHYGTSRASLEDDAEAMLIAGGSVSGDSAMEGESSAPCCSIQGCASQAIRVVTVPIEALLSITIPPLCHGEGEPDVSKVWPQTLVVSLVYVALLSWAVLELTTGVADMIGMPHHIAGLTILAIGAQVEDLFASVSVAKKGKGPSAISNAVGSQVINILLGIGLPFLVFNLYTGKDVFMKQGKVGGSVMLSAVALTSLVAVFLFLCFRTCAMHRLRETRSGNQGGPEDRKPSLSSFDAVVLMVLYGVNLAVIVAHGTGYIEFEL